MTHIHIIHENDDWTNHLINRLEELNLPYKNWHLAEGLVDLTDTPPEGIFYNRMSASSHTRGHRYAPELASGVINWLERHNRKVFNGSKALGMEISKINQYTALQAAGIKTPATIAAVGQNNIITAAKKLGMTPFITKHNRAGKGLGVQLFQSVEALEEYVNSPLFEEPVDGITLIQQYILSPDSSITRCEFIGGKFLYAVRVDTSKGFELCPADACQIEDLFCPVGEQEDISPQFKIIKDFNDPIIAKYEEFLTSASIDIAGIEFIRNQDGMIYTYDINTNTNYNSDAEAEAGQYGMLELAKFLGAELDKANGSNIS